MYLHYPAIITREGRYTLASFPDCPGCQTFVEEGEDIEVMAREALEGWLEANLTRDLVPNRPGTVAVSRGADVRQISVPFRLGFRLRLRWVREISGETQAEFAKKVGMTQQQYARLEGAKSNPTLETVDRVTSYAPLHDELVAVYDVIPINHGQHKRVIRGHRSTYRHTADRKVSARKTSKKGIGRPREARH